MAEYCSKCAKKYGFKLETEPELCEGCGELRQNKSNKLLWIISVTGSVVSIEMVGVLKEFAEGY